MAEITATRVALGNSITPVELTGSDTLAQKTGTLYIDNQSASEATINLDGDGATTVNTQGAGIVDLSGGYDVVVAVGEIAIVPLTSIAAYLSGDVAVTGGTTDVFAYIVG